MRIKCLYHHLAKKRRSWFDGVVRVGERRIELLDEDGRCIDSVFRCHVASLDPGETFDLSQYGVELEGVLDELAVAAVPAPQAPESAEPPPVAPQRLRGPPRLRRKVPLVARVPAASVAPPPAAAAPAPPPMAPRSDADILALLEGGAPASPAAGPPAPEPSVTARPHRSDWQSLARKQPLPGGRSTDAPLTQEPSVTARPHRSDWQPPARKQPLPGGRSTDAPLAPDASATTRPRRSDWQPPARKPDAVPSRVPPTRTPAGPAGPAVGVVFPTRQAAQARPAARVPIPESFSSVRSYQDVFLRALYQELNFEIAAVARDLYKAGTGAGAGVTPPRCQHGAARLSIVSKDGPNQGRPFFGCSGPRDAQCNLFQWADIDKQTGQRRETAAVAIPSRPIDREQHYRRLGIAYHADAELTVAEVPRRFQQTPTSGGLRWTLELATKLPAASYAKDDLWVLSDTVDFDRRLALFRSVFHGPTSQSTIQLAPVSPTTAAPNTRVVQAVRVLHAASALTMIESMESVAHNCFPVLPALLAPPPGPPIDDSPFRLGIPRAELDQRLRDAIAQRGLNVDQGEVLWRVCEWFVCADDAASGRDADGPARPVLLVHGVFGAGKSYLMAVIVEFLVALLDAAGTPECRILVTSLTNTAVDRVLDGLVDRVAFARVGNLRKIAKPILPYTLAGSSQEEKEAERELKAMLDSPTCTGSDRAHVRRALEELTSGRMAERAQHMQSFRVVGATCHAAALPVLSGQMFPIVLVDEASQSLEPLIVVPMSRFGCSRALLVGDPKQLSPILSHGGESNDDTAHLGKPMFERLAQLGHQPVLLRTQYRCHPAISRVPNALFYHGRLLDGITPDDRPGLVPLPPMCFVDVAQGNEQRSPGNSYRNTVEARLVAELVTGILESGGGTISASDIGVICLYKGQVQQVEQDLRGHPLVQVSTVDAFQGAEKEIIIVSAVRTLRLGFVDSRRRLNVALTRARSHAVVFGRRALLAGSEHWRGMLQLLAGEPRGIMAPGELFKHQPPDDDFVCEDPMGEPVGPPEDEDPEMEALLQLQTEAGGGVL